MTQKVLLCGCGSVGHYAAMLLSKDSFYVRAVDISLNALLNIQEKTGNRVEAIPLNLKDKTLVDFLREFSNGCEYAIVAVPGDFGQEYVNILIERCPDVKYIFDVSFAPEELVGEIDELAKKFGKKVFRDLGVMPGLGDILLGNAYRKINNIVKMVVCVAGLITDGSFKFVFCSENTLEEYLRNVSIKVNGNWQVAPAMSEMEERDYAEVHPGFGQMKVVGNKLCFFLTNGMRTAKYSFPDVPNIYEKTGRFPRNYAEIQALLKWGFLDREKRFVVKADEQLFYVFFRVMNKVKGDVCLDKAELALLRGMGLLNLKEAIGLTGSFTAFELTHHVLKEVWKMKPEDRDFLLLEVFVQDQNDFYHLYRFHAPYNEELGISAISHATAAPLVTAVRACACGKVDRELENGVIIPAEIGKNAKLMKFFEMDLEKQGLFWELEMGYNS